MNISIRSPLIIVFLSCYLCIVKMCFAQATLDVSGIVTGTNPVAIVDGAMVKKGDHVQEFTVEEIGKDFVRFTSGNGESVVKKLGDKVGGSDQPPAPVAAPRQKSETSSADVAQRDEAVKRHVTEAVNHIAAAQNIMRSQKVINQEAFQKALALYTKAERALQFALQRTAIDTPDRKTVQAAIAAVREENRMVFADAKALEAKIKSATQDGKVVMGMTKAEAIKSVGRPISVNTGNYAGTVAEQWIYKDTYGKSIYLYFDDGILTSFQY